MVQYIDNTGFINNLPPKSSGASDAKLVDGLRPKEAMPKAKTKKMKKDIANFQDKLFFRIHQHKRDKNCGDLPLSPCAYMPAGIAVNSNNEHEDDFATLIKDYDQRMETLKAGMKAFKKKK